MAWLNNEDMMKHKSDFEWYVVRRTDTGQYYKKMKSGFNKFWTADDPRLQRWTDDVELATTYTKNGIKQALSVAKKATAVWRPELCHWVPNPDADVEVVTLKVHVSEERVPSTLDFWDESAMSDEETKEEVKE